MASANEQPKGRAKFKGSATHQAAQAAAAEAAAKQAKSDTAQAKPAETEKAGG